MISISWIVIYNWKLLGGIPAQHVAGRRKGKFYLGEIK
jgi:hypothetical protein